MKNVFPMRAAAQALLLLALLSCEKFPVAEEADDPSPVSLEELAQIFSHLPLEQEHLDEVHTAVTLRRGTHIEHVRECTEVTFAPVSEQLARIYVASGESDDKSGSYALQGIASMLIERVRGSVSCVVGLPACQVRQALEKFGLFPKTVRAMP